MPLQSEQPKLRDELCDLILWILQSNLAFYATASKDQQVQMLDAVAWATQLRTPSPSLVRLKQELERLAGRQQGSGDNSPPIEAPPRAMDYFLAGEQIRQSASGNSGLRRWKEESDAQQTHSQIKLALEEYDQALALDASHYWSHFQRGRCFLALSRYGEAIEAFNTCIALRDHVPWAFSARGLAFSLQNDFEQALRDFEQAISINPQHPAARLNRGVVYGLMGPDHYDKAIDDLTMILESSQKQLVTEAAFARSQFLLRQ